MNVHFPFDRVKAAEAVAEFLRLSGGAINILKLVKLVYLLDRESIKRRGVPVVGGYYVSMKHGPVTSEVLNTINSGGQDSFDTTWSEHIADRENNFVSLKKDPGSDHLARSEMAIISELYHEHQTRDQWALRDWCHENCDEWTETSSAIPINVDRLARALARPADELAALVEEGVFAQKVFGVS